MKHLDVHVFGFIASYLSLRVSSSYLGNISLRIQKGPGFKKRNNYSYKSLFKLGKERFELLVKLGFLAEWTTVSNGGSR